MNKLSRIFIFGLFFQSTVALANADHIAGLLPDQRPAGAPVIAKFEATDAWKAQALRGIAEPHNGLGFLKDQGTWYTPFIHPNLPGRYDIRGLHNTDKKKD